MKRACVKRKFSTGPKYSKELINVMARVEKKKTNDDSNTIIVNLTIPADVFWSNVGRGVAMGVLLVVVYECARYHKKKHVEEYQ